MPAMRLKVQSAKFKVQKKKEGNRGADHPMHPAVTGPHHGGVGRASASEKNLCADVEVQQKAQGQCGKWAVLGRRRDGSDWGQSVE